MSKNRIVTIVFLVIGLLLHIALTVIFFNLGHYLAKSVRLYNRAYGVINDLALGASVSYLISYIIIRNEKEYYTNRHATLFVISYPIAAYSLLIILPKADYLLLFRISFLIVSLLFIVVIFLYIFVNKIYNPLIKDIVIVEKNVKASTTLNVVLVIVYALSLIANYVFIDYPIANVIIATGIYIIFIVCVIIFCVSLAVDIYIDHDEDNYNHN